MSIRLITRVFDTKVGDHVAKSVLLKLADNANDAGIAWPRVEDISEDTEIPRRTVTRKLSWLEAEGFIERRGERRQDGKFGGTVYLVLPQATVASGTAGHRERTAGHTRARSVSRPSVDRQSAAGPRSRPRDPLWDALTEIFGDATTEGAASLRGKIVRSLRAAGATPEDVAERAARYPKVMPPDTLMTETALEKHWALCAPKKRKAAPAEPPREEIVLTEAEAEANRRQAAEMAARLARSVGVT